MIVVKLGWPVCRDIYAAIRVPHRLAETVKVQNNDRFQMTAIDIVELVNASQSTLKVFGLNRLAVC